LEEEKRMVNKVIVEYLRKYKDKYEVDDLKHEIIGKGYNEYEFGRALKFVEKNKVKSLPNTNLVKSKKKGFSAGKLVTILFALLLFGAGLIVLFNYFQYNFFGWNFFDFLSNLD
jgi:hypothetical protein